MFQQGNQFGGSYQSMDSHGGFMPGGFSSPPEGSQERKRTGTKVQTLIPVTIAQLYKASYDEGADCFILGGTPIHQVTFVGLVKEIQEATTNIMYKIDDMTADSMSVRKWIDDNDRDAMNMRSVIREDSYVRIIGHLKLLQSNKPTLIAFSITPVTDFNEITYHLIQVAHAHLALSKLDGSSVTNKGLSTPLGNTSFNRGMNTSGMDNSFGGGAADLGLSRTQKMVHDAISLCHSDEGMGINELRQMLKSLSPNDIRDAVEFLSNEGHVYSTIDDDHFKSTS